MLARAMWSLPIFSAVRLVHGESFGRICRPLLIKLRIVQGVIPDAIGHGMRNCIVSWSVFFVLREGKKHGMTFAQSADVSPLKNRSILEY
jgi:hypothetical protein